MKALLRHELRNIWGIILYFIGGVILNSCMIFNKINGNYLYYLRDGYDYDMGTNLLDAIVSMYDIYIIGLGAGLLMLLYVQFRDNKSIQISSFIKSLPYTNKQIYGVKWLCGSLSFTLPFGLLTLIITFIGHQQRSYLELIERVSPIGEQFAMQNSVGQIVLYIAMVYSMTLMIYTFGFWMQYIINPNIGSLIISGCSLVAIPFMSTTLCEYVLFLTDVNGMGRSAYWRAMNTLLLLPTYFDNETRVRIGVGQKENYHMYNLQDTYLMGLEIGLFLVLAAVFGIAIMICNKNYHAENQEAFMRSKVIETILKIGVTVSSMGVGFFIISNLINGYSENIVVWVHIGMIISGAIGYVVIHKICQLGKR